MPARTSRCRRALPMILAALSLASVGCGRTATTDAIAQARSAESADRARAAKTLGERPKDAEQVVPVLIDLLKDPDAFVRRDAAQALGRLGSKAESASAALRAAAQDRNPHVRRAATEAIQKVNPSGNVRVTPP